MCIRNLDKPILIWQFDFTLKPNFTTSQAASKKLLTSEMAKSDQKWPTSKHIASFIKFKFQSLIHSVVVHFLAKLRPGLVNPLDEGGGGAGGVAGGGAVSM